MPKTKSAVSPKTHEPLTPARPPTRNTGLVDSLMRLMERETGKAIQFEVAAQRDSRVCVAGTFNNWDPTSHPLTYHPEDGLYKATLLIDAGTHEYKIVVDGVWHRDEKCPHWKRNALGTLNSVIKV